MTDALHPNHEFILRWLETIDPHHALRTVDYGCGGGELVVAGRARGIQIWGTDVFYADGSDRDRVAETGLLGDVVREIEGGRAPFADGEFDLLVSNQVLEHVRDLDAVIDEWARLIRSGGRFLALFPTRETLREAHVGVPMLHRFPPGRAREVYATAVRRAGFGYHHRSLPPRAWAREAVDWVDSYTTYRPWRDVRASLARHFELRTISTELIRFRLSGSRWPWLATATDLRVVDKVSPVALRLLAGEVLEGTRR
jgi:SAM-dependent methyltransferase